MRAYERLLKYVKVWTTSDPESGTHPSTMRQFDLAHQLVQELKDLGLTDAFRMFEQPEKSFSWWDYRMLGFQKNRGLRIDHILVSEALKARTTACVVDRAPRKNKQPSDHAPVVVTMG